MEKLPFRNPLSKQNNGNECFLSYDVECYHFARLQCSSVSHVFEIVLLKIASFGGCCKMLL
ncbi:CLUMA_CG001858, isoform A [Clunio marinus]|uniref:CLUMA_CG001858, isoform A n=1 Tax=Clunio marinus TaxID=568069 RepID=A0A1J1HPD5_9DIPT|nr:CLUMA_CG001858, isoform A [Clunio marinus]